MRIHRHTFLALGSVLALSLGACDVAESAVLADGPVQGSLDTNTLPGGAIELVFNFQDSEGRQVRNFEIEHEKLMHTIVVSEDLKSFAHVHPELQFNNSFTLRLNEPNEDPDNQMAINAIPRGGKYFVFSEIKPRGAHEVQEHRFDFFVGEEASETEPLVVDQQISNLKYIRYFAQNDSVGTADEVVDSVYKVTLTKERIQGMKMNHEMSGKVMFMLPGKDEMLHFVFELQVRADADSPYEVVKDLVNWLGMKGHAILIGEAGETVKDRVFRHMHAGHHGGNHGGGGMGHHDGNHGGGMGNDGGAGHHGDGHGDGEPEMKMSLIPAEGVYKIWSQFKRSSGAILTFPFVVEIQ